MPGPAPAVLARWAFKYGPLMVPVAKRLYDQGRFRQLAILHARTLVDGAFSSEFVDGERLWVVWSGAHAAASYPETDGDLTFLLGAARPDRRQDPDDVVVRRVRRRIAGVSMPSMPSVPARLRRKTEDAEEASPAVAEGWEDAPPPQLPTSRL